MTTQSGEGGKQAASPTMTLRELHKQAKNGDTFILYTNTNREYRCRWTRVTQGLFELPIGSDEGHVSGAPNTRVKPEVRQ